LAAETFIENTISFSPNKNFTLGLLYKYKVMSVFGFTVFL